MVLSEVCQAELSSPSRLEALTSYVANHFFRSSAKRVEVDRRASQAGAPEIPALEPVKFPKELKAAPSFKQLCNFRDRLQAKIDDEMNLISIKSKLLNFYPMLGRCLFKQLPAALPNLSMLEDRQYLALKQRWASSLPKLEL